MIMVRSALPTCAAAQPGGRTIINATGAGKPTIYYRNRSSGFYAALWSATNRNFPELHVKNGNGYRFGVKAIRIIWQKIYQVIFFLKMI
jgi:hypothetical protein